MRFLASAAIAAIAQVLLAAEVGAQQANAEPVLEEIIVTAQRRAEPLQRVPASVDVLSGDQIERARIADVLDLAKLSPSVTLTESPSPSGSNILIRGVGTFSFNPNVEPSVAIVLDGVPLFRLSQGFTDFADLERIEVLRGPQGTLFGKNASAGVISINTRAPGRDLRASLTASIYEGPEYRIVGGLSGPLSERFSIGVSGSFQDVEPQVRNSFNGRPLNDQRTASVRAQAAYRPNDATVVRLIGDYSRVKVNGNEEYAYLIRDPAYRAVLGRYGIVPGPDNRQVSINGPSRSDVKDFGVAAIIESDVGAFTVTSVTAYRGSRSLAWDDVDNRANTQPVFGPSRTPFGPGVTAVGPFDVLQFTDASIDQFSQEIRFASANESRFQYVAGVFAFYGERTQVFQRTFNACIYPNVGLGLLANVPAGTDCSALPSVPGTPIRPFTFSSIANPVATSTAGVRNVNLAAFGQGEYSATDQLTFILGLRYQYDDIRVEVGQPAPSLVPGFSATGGQSAGTVDKTQLTGKAGVRYEFAPGTIAYATYGRGYKAPTAGSLGNGQYVILKPETSNAYEVGIKATLFDRRATLNIAGFWTDFRNFQGEAYNADSRTFTIINAGKVRTRGIEFDLAARLTEGLSLSLGGAFTEAEYVEFRNAPCFNPRTADALCRQTAPGVFARDLSGRPVSNSPRWKLTGDLRYELPVADAFSVFLDLNARWQSRFSFDAGGNLGNPNLFQDAFAVVDGRLGLLRQREGSATYELSLDVNNIFDQTYSSSRFQDFVVLDSANIVQRVPKSAHRFVGVTLRVRR